MAKRRINWDAVEPLFRKGVLSNYEIAAQYAADHVNSQTWANTVSESAIRNRAKTKGWEKNLSGKVKDRVKEKILRSKLRAAQKGKSAALSDDQIIEAAAEAGSEIIFRHQQEIITLKELEDKFLIELGSDPTKLHFASYQGEISSEVVSLTVSEKAKTLKDLAEVRAKRISLERQAHNLGDDPGSAGEMSHEDWLREMGA